MKVFQVIVYLCPTWIWCQQILRCDFYCTQVWNKFFSDSLSPHFTLFVLILIKDNRIDYEILYLGVGAVRA